MRELKGLKKNDLLEILIEEFGYEQEDLNGKTVKELKVMIDEEDKYEEEREKKIVEESKPKTSQVDLDAHVDIMCGTTGIVFYQSQTTGQVWKFTQLGQTDQMTIRELTRVRNMHPRYLNENWIIVLDDEVVKYLGLSEIYENLMKPHEIDEFFKLSAESMREKLDKFPQGMKKLIASIAKERFDNKKLTDMLQIQVIQEKLNVIINPDTV